MKVWESILMAVIATAGPTLARAQLPGAEGHISQIIGPDGSALRRTDDVELVKFGSLRPVLVYQDSLLQSGDELRAVTGRTIIVVTCSDSARVTLEGEFRAVAAPAQGGKACFFDLSAGTAAVQGDTGTGLGAGDVTMGARRTQYSLTISRSGDSVRRDLQVFDGTVAVRSIGRLDSLTAGAASIVGRGVLEPRPITPQQYDRTSSLYARVDASVVPADLRPTATASFARSYQGILSHPDDGPARIALIGEQLQYGAVNRGTVYHLERGRAVSPPSKQSQQALAAIGVAVFTQLGEEDQARTRYESLRGVDAQTVQSALQVYGIDTQVVRRAGRLEIRRQLVNLPLPLATLRLRVSAEPQIIPVGGRTRIIVRVIEGSGALLAGATVKLAAGGGVFVGGQPSVEGLTDASGAFMTVWSCRPCGVAYALPVKVTKAGFAAESTAVRVEIR